MSALPVVQDPASHACAECHGPCCYEYDVNVNGRDLVRLTLALGLPWQAVVRTKTQKSMLFFGFRLDGGPLYFHFYLHRRESGACQFLLEIEGGYRRCGVHALRPDACRIYPLNSHGEADPTLTGDAICPPGPRAEYEA